MDNATHALIGLLVAEAAIVWRSRSGREASPEFRRAARWTSVLANNLGDLDFLYARRLGGKLGYLLHHRGHTHTLLIGVLLGLGLFGAWRLLARRRGVTFTRAESRAILGLCALGPLLHIGMDFLNNYGVHPAWPFDERWIYGDSLFIIEPWLWIALAAPLLFAVSSRALRIALGVLLAVGVLLAWALSLVPLGLAVLLTFATALAVGVCRAKSPRFRLGFAAFGFVAVVLGFAATSRLARASVVAAVQGEAPLDVVITPCPGNPLCFSAVTAARSGDDYRVRAGRVSVLPGFVSAEGCRVQPTGLTLGLAQPSIVSTRAVHWEGEWRGSVSELRRLAASHCEVAAWLRFARVPFWEPRDQGWLIGDLRFDRDPELDFDELELTRRPSECPPWVPPWRPPRSDLLP